MIRDLPPSLLQQDFAAVVPEPLREADEVLTAYGIWATKRRGRGGPDTLDRWFNRSADPSESLDAFIRRREHVPAPRVMSTPDALIAQRALARVADQERVVLAILYVPERLPPARQFLILRIPPQLSRTRHLAGLRMFDNLRRLAALRRE